MLSEGDRVVMQLLMEGTHQSAWLGIPASGKKMQIRMFTVHRVVQGKIVEDWVLVESLGVFQQLGVVPNTADLVGKFLASARQLLIPGDNVSSTPVHTGQ
jgi:hypothetical protein